MFKWFRRRPKVDPAPATKAAVTKELLKEKWAEAGEKTKFLLTDPAFKEMNKLLKEEAMNKILDSFAEEYLDPFTKL